MRAKLLLVAWVFYCGAGLPLVAHADASPSALRTVQGELAGELDFRSGEWAVDGPFRLVLFPPTADGESPTLSFRADTAALPTGLTLSELRLEAFANLARNRITIRHATFAALGGHVVLRPFEIDLSNLETLALGTTAELHSLSLAQLASFVPEAVRQATGRVSGQVTLQWREASGLQIGTGTLRIDPDTAAQIYLASMPGFLTQHTTPRFTWMPASFGRLARWLSLDNPAYDTLAQIETGSQPLRIETLQIALYPDGPGGPRTAAVSLTAHPENGALVKQLRFDINLSGPLEQVLRLGASDSVRLNFNAQ